MPVTRARLATIGIGRINVCLANSKIQKLIIHDGTYRQILRGLYRSHLILIIRQEPTKLVNLSESAEILFVQIVRNQ